nr:hypothetical protein [Tanacetum cinerariifolium]
SLEICSLKRRVKKLEKKQRSRTRKLKRLYKVDEGITLVSTHDDAEMFDADKDLHDEEVFVAKQDENVVEKEVDAAQVQVSTTATTATISIDEVSLAQALAELKHIKPIDKAKGIVFHELEESIIISKPKSHDKGKAMMIEEHVKLKKKDQIMLDKEVALKLQAELQDVLDKEEQRLVRESAKKEQEVNSALIEEWNDIQEKIDADYLLAQRLQAEEQQELTDDEKATLFMQFLKKRRKFFTGKAIEEKRNKLPTQAQQIKIMCTYLKNMEGKKLKDLKNKSFDSIQKMFDKDFKRVNTFESITLKLVEGSSKRAGTELVQKSSKKQKIDDDEETDEIKQLVKIIPNEEGVAINVI